MYFGVSRSRFLDEHSDVRIVPRPGSAPISQCLAFFHRRKSPARIGAGPGFRVGRLKVPRRRRPPDPNHANFKRGNFVPRRLLATDWLLTIPQGDDMRQSQIAAVIARDILHDDPTGTKTAVVACLRPQLSLSGQTGRSQWQFLLAPVPRLVRR